MWDPDGAAQDTGDAGHRGFPIHEFDVVSVHDTVSRVLLLH